jgi:transposase-like protein
MHFEEGLDYRRIVHRLRDEGMTRVNHMQIHREVDQLVTAAKDGNQVARELGLRLSGYLGLDRTKVKVGGSSRYVLIMIDAVTWYLHACELLEHPLETQDDRWMVESIRRQLETIYAGRAKPVMVVIDDDPIHQQAVIEALGSNQPIQLCLRHVADHLDKLMPTTRNPKIPGWRRAKWKQLKQVIDRILQAPTQQEFDSRLKALLDSRWWLHDGKMESGVKYICDRYSLIVTHYRFPGAPRTNNVCERRTQDVKRWSRRRRGFKNPDSARAKLRMKANQLNFSPFTDSETGLNGKSPEELSGGPTNADWVQICAPKSTTNRRHHRYIH